MVRALSTSVYPIMVGENFQIYSVQITGKCICETFPPSLHDQIIRPHEKQSPHKFVKKKVCSPMKIFFKRKKSFLNFVGRRRHYTLPSYALASFLASMV